MNNGLEQDRLVAVRAAVRMAFQAATLDASEAPDVVPLRRLIAAQPLIVEEVPGLTRLVAERHLARRAGRPLLEELGSDDRLAGFIHVTPAGGWILVERDDPLVRRRFSIAHELGHFLIHFEPLLARLSEEGDVDMAVSEGLQAPSAGSIELVGNRHDRA